MNKEIIKKYLEQILRGIVTGISIFTWISICILSIYAFDWSGVSTVNSGTTLTASLWNTTMNTITGAIQKLENEDITIWWTKTFTNLPESSQTPNANNQLTTKDYVDTRVLAAWWGDGCSIIWWTCWWWILAWLIWGYSIIATPGGCTDSATPTCPWFNSTDTVTKFWNDWFTNRTSIATNYTDWATNTALLVTADSNAWTTWVQQHNAAKYCYDMVYWWYDDWYLPSQVEVTLIWTNRVIIWWSAWSSVYYASSSQNWVMINQNRSLRWDWGGTSQDKNVAQYVRCVRKFR